jgi:hypothetical protein
MSMVQSLDIGFIKFILHLKTYFAAVLLKYILEVMEANLLTTSLSANEVSVIFGHLESVSFPPLFGEE